MFYLTIKHNRTWILTGIFATRQEANTAGFEYLKNGQAIKIYGVKQRD